MSDVLRQIDEELRRDRIKYYLKKYGLYASVIFIILISIVIGIQIKKSIDLSQSEKFVKQYLVATNSIDKQKTKELLIQLSGTSEHYIDQITKIQIANAYMEEGDIVKSNEILLDIINNNKNDVVIIDLATYFYLMANINSLNKNKFESYLPKIKIDKSKFKFLYKELLGIKYFLEGDLEFSKNIFQELIEDPDVPIELGIRANKFFEIIS